MKLFFSSLAGIVLLLNQGVSRVGSDVVSVSKKEGDSVIFHTGVKTNQQEYITWYFNKTRIAQISGDLSDICTDVRCNRESERFTDRLKLDNQTGSLTITNTKTKDSGVYTLKMITTDSNSEKIFRVTIDSVPDSGLSAGVAAGISLVALLVVAVVTADVT